MGKRSRNIVGLIGISMILAEFILGAPFSIHKALAEEKEVVVAAIIPLTGPLALWGTGADRGMRLVIDKINSQGGIKSLGGAKFKYIAADTEGKPEVAASQAEKIVAREVSCVIGCNQSASSLTASVVTERNKIPFNCPADGDPLHTARGFKYLFRSFPTMDVYVKSVFDFAQAMNKTYNTNFKKVGVLCEDSVVGDTTAKFIEKMAPGIGYTVLDVVRYNAATTKDFSGVISRFKAKGVELLLGHNRPADAIQWVRNCKEAEFNPAMVGGIIGAWGFPEVYSSLGSLAEGIVSFSSEPIGKSPGKFDEYKKEYETKYKEEIPLTAVLGASGIWLLYDAVERCGSKNPEEIAKALRTTDLKYGEGYYFTQFGCKFDERGENLRSGATVAQVQDGKRVGVFPLEYSVKKTIWPKPKFK